MTLSRSNWNLEMFVLRREENRSTQRKTSRSKDENQQQTQPTYDAESGNRTRVTLVGGECYHLCAIPCTLLNYIFCFLTGVKKPKSVMVTTSSPLSPELLTASTVTAPISSVHHHHYGDVTSQDGEKLRRKKRKAKKQQQDVLFCNFPNHEGLVSHSVSLPSLWVKTIT